MKTRNVWLLAAVIGSWAFGPVDPEPPVDASPAEETPASDEEAAVSDEEAAAPDEDAPPAAAPAAPDVSATPDAEGSEGEPTEDEIFEEVLVIGNQVVSAKRDEVVRSMEGMGWKARRKRSGVITFRPPVTSSWMGKAHLIPTGDLEFTQPVLAFNGARNTGGSYDRQGASDNDQQSGTVGISTSPLPDRRIVRATQTRIREEMAPVVLEYRRAIQGQHLARALEKIPLRLDKVWNEGVAFDGTPLATKADQRAWVLDYWATRTATPEGRQVCRVIEAWLRETVQLSDDPVTPEEHAEAEARREDGRPLKI